MSTVILRGRLKIALAAAAFVCACSISGFAQQQDPSQKPTGDAVADAARKAREQKKSEAEKSKKVYTNEDLGGMPANAVSSVGAAPGTSEGADNPGDKSKAQQGNKSKDGKAAGAEEDKDPEKLWRKRFKDAYAKLAQLEKEVDILQREQNKAQLEYYPDPQKALQEGYTRKDINEKDTKIAAKKQEIDQQKQKINDMEDDLRKAGGDPGWASPQ